MSKDPISLQDFLAWKETAITQAFLSNVVELIEMLIADLVVTAGVDPIQDRYKSGRIAGLSELADWRPNLINEDKDGNEI